MDTRKGFTLMELVLVLALFSILFSIAIPSFGFLKSYRVNQELKDFKRDIMYARNQAVVTGETHGLLIDYELNYYSILKNSISIKSHYFSNGIRLVKKASDMEHTPIYNIFFYRTGTPSNAGTVYLRDEKGEYYRITVSPATGNVNFYKGEK